MARQPKNNRVRRRTYRPPRRRSSALPFFLLSVLLALILAGCMWLKDNNWDISASWNKATAPDRYVSGPVESGFVRSKPETYSTAAQVLDTLPVRERSALSRYERSAFGEPWADINSNRCSTRNEILARDLEKPKLAGSCKVDTGILLDPYTSQKITFKRGAETSQEVPIDHVVALSNSWSTGASLLSEQDRLLLANDPLNLQATSLEANTDKSDADAAAWLPQKQYRCEYVARQISVKAAYSLWVTAAEKKAMSAVLKDCPDQPAYRSTLKR